jgi:hypothetical protein
MLGVGFEDNSLCSIGVSNHALNQGESNPSESPERFRQNPGALTPPRESPIHMNIAGVAQLVEHQLPKLRAAGSNPVARLSDVLRNLVIPRHPFLAPPAAPGLQDEVPT